ncbi:MAG: SprT family zinc-dependent metalloprotease [Oligoflexia bacterium]|nr:SprT family zinc-dependent metalloprotease [Oligoflexia bacterium]
MNTPHLENLLLHELARNWRHLNQLHFSGGMRPPVVTLFDSTTRLGEWRSAERSIAIARCLLMERSWLVVMEVLKHEMAHQYVDEVIKPVGETAHGPAFQRICKRLAIDASSQGLPQGESVDPRRQRALNKVRHLLALAESDNVHEAEAAMARAHALMRKYNIAWATDGSTARYVFRQVGPVRTRLPAHERLLAGILAQHFFVEVVWIWIYQPSRDADAKALELSGTPENVALAEYVHAFLLRTAERLWAQERARLAAAGLRGTRGRGRFMSGVMMGFGEKLTAQAQRCVQREGLVWLGDAGLEDYVARRHPRLRKGRRTRVIADGSWERGRQAGRDIVLHKPVEQSNSPRGRQIETRS